MIVSLDFIVISVMLCWFVLFVYVFVLFCACC